MSILRPFFKQQIDHDLDKPNFIFSSDIPDKVSNIVSRYLLFGESVPELVDITNIYSSVVEFNVSIELNSLLSRNKNLKPSDLIKDNLIFLAKSKDKCSSNVDNLLVAKHSKNGLSIQPYKLMSNEIFIVNLTLKLLDFMICMKEEAHEIMIDFLKDESYGIMLLSDEQLIEQIEKYIKTTFLKVLNNHITSNPLDQQPRRDCLNISSEYDKYPINSVDASMDMHDISMNNDKSFVYEDEYESSFEELLLLRSNDTRSTANDEVNEDFDDKTDTILFDIGCDQDVLRSNHDKMITMKNKQISTIKEEDIEDSFIDDMSNLRHNERCIRIDDIMEVGCTLDRMPSSNSIDTLTLHELKSSPSYLKSPIKLAHENPSSPKSLTRQLSMSSMSPGKHKSASRRTSTASFSMINYADNNPDLEYAFRNKSSTVPTFIKQDKKFKFIKVGKVQKFVNLFEENMAEPESKSSTRPGSPLKRSATPVKMP